MASLADVEARWRLLPCVACVHTGTTYWRKEGVELHHAGDADERDDENQVPLCHTHHQGALGIHHLHRRGFERQFKLGPLKMLAIRQQLYRKEFGV